MKIFLFICILGLNFNYLFAQKSGNISKQYADIFKITKQKYGEKEFLIKSIQKLPKKHCLATLVNENTQFFHYLCTHFAPNVTKEKLLHYKDSTTLQKQFILLLEEDSTFFHTMNALNQKSPTFRIDTISVNELLNIAVKFFSITKLTEKGYYVGKVCTSINGLKQTESKRNPHLEAFCFATIFTHYTNEKFNLHQEFTKGMKALYTINLGINDKEKLLRAQGAMYMFMKNNNTLKTLLLIEYEKKKDFLPFVVIDK